MKQFLAALMTWILIPTSASALDLDDLLLGFELGSTVEQAERHARSQDWKIEPLSPHLPREWKVVGAEAGLFVCEGRVLAVRRQLEGGLDEFAAMVQRMPAYLGKPTTQVATFMAGVTRISTVDTRFEEMDDIGASIQLSSTDGKIGLNTNVWLSVECSD
ncbi:hypothetical protein [Hoeflea poritis]|uniref:Uncharacterized protein n=1 Tax=Hoeflea poritis TaxID=2993659 RepID=A0ABT4VW60_9HYPH|nr:hypothetical protein [Hoeflea poritis]MDA4848287.1 hypothetical protein [Hoeflea poritis]